MDQIRHYCTFRNWNSEFKVWLYLDRPLVTGQRIDLNTSSDVVHGSWLVESSFLKHTSIGKNARGSVYEVVLVRATG